MDFSLFDFVMEFKERRLDLQPLSIPERAASQEWFHHSGECSFQKWSSTFLRGLWASLDSGRIRSGYSEHLRSVWKYFLFISGAPHPILTCHLRFFRIGFAFWETVVKEACCRTGPLHLNQRSSRRAWLPRCRHFLRLKLAFEESLILWPLGLVSCSST